MRKLEILQLLAVGALIVLSAPGRAQPMPGEWYEVAPPVRSEHATVYDPQGRRMLVLGRSDHIWSFHLEAPYPWESIRVGGPPDADLVYRSAAYDSLRRRVIVMAVVRTGHRATDYFQVWELRLDQELEWSLLSVDGPRNRFGFSTILDPVRRRLIVFGGDQPISSSSNRLTNELWAFDLETATWQELNPQGLLPVERAFHSAIYDPLRDRMVVFGGWSQRLQTSEDIVVDEVWSLGLGNALEWAFISPVAPVPAGRAHHSAIYEAYTDRMLIFGGEFVDYTHTNELWALRLNRERAEWSRLSVAGPEGRMDHAALYDPKYRTMIVHGGLSRVDRYDLAPRYDVWKWSGGWELIGGGARQIGFHGGLAFHDPQADRMLVTDGLQNDAWQLSFGTATWSRLAEGEPPPYGSIAVGAFDTRGQRAVLLVQSETTTGLWTLSASTSWTRQPLKGDWPTVAQAAAIYDPLAHRVLVFGGITPGVGSSFIYHNDVWELGLDDLFWTKLSVSGSLPGVRRSHQAMYDEENHRMLVFGGVDTVRALKDVWALSLTEPVAWTQLTAKGEPPPSLVNGAIYDPARAQIVAIETRTETLAVWHLPLSGDRTWSRESSRVPHRGGPAIFDSSRDRVVIFGRSNRNDLLAHSLAGVTTPAAISLVDVQTDPQRVRLRWYTPDHGLEAALYRRAWDEAWTQVAELLSDGSGHLAYEDRDVIPGARYEYRLGVHESGHEHYVGFISVQVPEHASLGAMRILRNPVVTDLVVSFALEDRAPAELELFDVGGRSILKRSVGELGAGAHVLNLGRPSRSWPGTYFLRLRNGNRSETKKVVFSESRLPSLE